MPNDTNLVIAPATIAEIEAIARIHAASWKTTYRGSLRDDFLDGDIETDKRQHWTKRLTQPPANQTLLLARQNGVLMGFACLLAHHSDQWGHLLDAIHLDPNAKRQGIGSRLFAEIITRARAIAPDAGLHLYVNQSNHGACRFYDARGGRIVDHFDWHAPDGSTVPRHIYAWRAAELN
jgi:ribosomal protein S18 acetylase RimI-like enzyme